MNTVGSADPARSSAENAWNPVCRIARASSGSDAMCDADYGLRPSFPAARLDLLNSTITG